MSNATSEVMIQEHKIKCLKAGAEMACNRIGRIGSYLRELLESASMPEKQSVALGNIKECLDDVERFLDNLRA